MSSAGISPSIVEYFGGDSGHRCGYCKGENTSFSHGMWAHSMRVQDYEDLINRGWRRSGQYCYKPIMNVTCCPQYSIRCDAVSFQLNHSHKKVLKKVRNFLLKGTAPSNKNSKHEVTAGNTGHERYPEHLIKKTANKTETSIESVAAQKSPKSQRSQKDINKLPKSSKSYEKSNESGEKLTNKSQNTSKSLEDFLEEIPAEGCHKLEIILINSSSSKFKDTLTVSHQLYMKYQMKVHQDKEEECTLEQFKRFLVKSPLQKGQDEGGSPESSMEYGSFHQQYWLDGKKLIAVGVVDILPSCLSSVYFFYDPDFSFLSLGTYAALREIAFVRQWNQKDANFRWYYLGFYIHSCPKMVYKGQYKPSFLVCPESNTWHPIAECTPKLDSSKYSRLSKNEVVTEDSVDLSQVGILFKRQPLTYSVYCLLKRGNTEDEEEVKKYASLVGREPARRMLLYRS